MGLVHLPTCVVDGDGFHIGKYTRPIDPMAYKRLKFKRLPFYLKKDEILDIRIFFFLGGEGLDKKKQNNYCKCF